jgi:hypothetical protein
MTSWGEIERQVQRRAAARCEYCLMHESLQGATFHVEHIVPRSRGGASTLDNLAWACPSCNLRKSDRIQVSDPATVALVPLFNPRPDRWNEHFRWGNYQILALTPVGRATVAALELNAPRRLRIREAEQMFELFPPSLT